jgi:hypothetical protein
MSLAEAFRAEFRRILDAEPTFTFRTCARLEQLARAAKSALQAAGGVPGALQAIMGDDGDIGDVAMVGSSAFTSIGALSPSPASETFGVKVIQEAIAALPELMKRFEKKPPPPKPEDPLVLVRAIKEAREAKLDSIADALELRLRVATATVVVERVEHQDAEAAEGEPPVFLPQETSDEVDVAAAAQPVVDLDIGGDTHRPGVPEHTCSAGHGGKRVGAEWCRGCRYADDLGLQQQKPLELSDADKRELMTVEVAGGGSVYINGPQDSRWASYAGEARFDGPAFDAAPPSPVNAQGMAYAKPETYVLEPFPEEQPTKFGEE